MKWLFVTADPWPMHHGTALRVFHLARELVITGDEVTVLSDWQGDGADDAYCEAGVKYQGIPATERERFPARGNIYPCNRNFFSELDERVNSYDVVVLFAAELLQYATACRKCHRVIADVIDDPVLAARRRLMRPSSLRWALRNLRLLRDLRQYERQYRGSIDLFSFVTEVDAGSFKHRNRTSKTATIPNGVSLAAWTGVIPSASASPYLAFVGNYAFVPNRTAAEFLVRKVAPLVWDSCLEVRFLLVGGNPPDWLSCHPDQRIATTGFVDDVRPFVSGAKGVVIPMVTGTGIKNKLLEAWAAHKPVVATPLACQGVPAVDGENVLLGRNARELASAIMKVWKDTAVAARVAANGHDVVARDFAWSTMAAKLKFAAADVPGRHQ